MIETTPFHEFGDWQSPIMMHTDSEMICEKFKEDHEKAFKDALKATLMKRYAFDVDIDELIKAVNYDRNQYEKGFNDGFFRAKALYDRGEVEMPEGRSAGRCECGQFVNRLNKFCHECGRKIEWRE